ncbi:MAG: restriction endonuclease subunit M [Oscillospiraceae bacterium]
MVSKNLVDIKENDIIKYDKELLPILLKDNSSKHNIIWATDNYVSLGWWYNTNEEIIASLITRQKGNIIKPRVNKNKKEQLSRVRDKAEVFTPSWICNNQNNLVDNAWFGAEDVFNIETHNGWQTIDRPIPFSIKEGKSWQDYVKDIRMEVSCGEAPYLVSRYDTISGEPIEQSERIGLLDRKMRVVSENTDTCEDWNKWAKIAFQSIYGFEWQGDSLLLARENLLFSFIDYYQAQFVKDPPIELLREIAEIISWNVWQMDGLKGVIPNSCISKKTIDYDLFRPAEESIVLCNGCAKNNIHQHNGIYCKIKDWETGKTLKFISLLKR